MDTAHPGLIAHSRELIFRIQLLCTGQKANTAILAAMDPAAINPENGQAYVQRTMQLTTAPVETQSDELASATDASLSLTERSTRPKVVPHTYPSIFVVGDAADAFGAIAAGHNAYYQVMDLLFGAKSAAGNFDADFVTG